MLQTLFPNTRILQVPADDLSPDARPSQMPPQQPSDTGPQGNAARTTDAAKAQPVLGNRGPNQQSAGQRGPGQQGPNRPGPGKQGMGKQAMGKQGPGTDRPGPQAMRNPALMTANGADAPAQDALQKDPLTVRPVVQQARPKRRHHLMMLSFVFAVLMPSAVTSIYLYTIAEDRYASTVAFSVRAEQASSASDLLGGFSSLVGGATSQDSDVLYEFVQSQDMVAEIDRKLDLRKLYSKPTADPVFSFPRDGSIEDLVAYWSSMVSVAYDGSTGLIQIETQAFTPQDAQAIAQAIYAESSRMINDLSLTAREDATRYALEDMNSAETRVKAARNALNDYRSRTQIVDPNANVQSQMGILNQLQSQMAEALIQIDLLRATTRADDPRIADAELKISVIEKRIAEERSKFSTGGQGIGNADFGTVVAEFERLTVDRDFAERAYVAAMTALDSAKAQAQRQSRYLAAFIRPTLAETAEYPQRGLLSVLTLAFLTLGWSIIALIYYSIRDRR